VLFTLRTESLNGLSCAVKDRGDRTILTRLKVQDLNYKGQECRLFQFQDISQLKQNLELKA
jgi:hypothetical protein